MRSLFKNVEPLELRYNVYYHLVQAAKQCDKVSEVFTGIDQLKSQFVQCPPSNEQMQKLYRLLHDVLKDTNSELAAEVLIELSNKPQSPVVANINDPIRIDYDEPMDHIPFDGDDSMSDNLSIADCTEMHRNTKAKRSKLAASSVNDKRPNGNFECYLCGEAYLRLAQVKEHMWLNHIKSRSVSTSESLIEFVAIKHPTAGRPKTAEYNRTCFQCEVPRLFDRPWDLKVHIQAAHTINRFKCNLCLNEYKYKCDLNKHTKKHHLSKNRKLKKK